MFSLGSREEYLHKAKEAEMQQQRAKSLLVKSAWERIVIGYLELADMARRRDDYGLALFSRLDGASDHHP
jgi:hypothetical protein